MVMSFAALDCLNAQITDMGFMKIKREICYSFLCGWSIFSSKMVYTPAFAAFLVRTKKAAKAVILHSV